MLCNESVHINCIKKFHDDIALAAIMTSDVIPETVKESNDFPGWTKETSYLREIALFWRSIWIRLNSPRSGIVADIMRHTRCKYHYAIRIRKKIKLRKEAMANAISQNNSRQLWDEIKKVRKSIQLIRIVLMHNWS